MAHHHGHIVEKVIRRDGHSIGDISRLMKVNRRSVYNWFNQPKLRPEIIFRIGCIIKYDFSAELPHVFNSEDFASEIDKNKTSQDVKEEMVVKDDDYWKEKYTELLKSYDRLKQGHIFVAI